MRFNDNIVKALKNNDKFKNINDQNLLVKEFDLAVVHAFKELKSVENFLALINNVNSIIYAQNKAKTIKLRHLQYHAFHNSNRYTHFYISKKSGGERTINAPVKALKNIQTTINYILSCVYKPQMPAHGFLKNRSVVTSAKHHVGKNYVYNIDLKNFFPSIHKARIEKRLQLPPFNLTDDKTDIAIIISRLTTQKVLEFSDAKTGKREQLSLENKKLLALPENKKILKKYKENDEQSSFKTFAVLPQGAPSSPIISNFICDRLDRRLLGLAKRFKAKYTRYADDITFSSMHNIYQKDSEFLKELHEIIKSQNFDLNDKKTRLQKRGYKQEVTGVIVNDKTNVSRKYIKQLRAMLYAIEKHGIKKAEQSFRKHYKNDRGYSKNGVPSILNVLHGKLEYLKMVKAADDSTYLKLKKRYDVIISSEVDLGLGKDEQKTSMNKYKKVKYIHNPKKLVELLSIFTQNNNPLKYTTHSWDMGQLEGKWENYDDFIKQLSSEWKKISKGIKQIKPQLHAKISNFLFNKELGATKDNKKVYWGIHNKFQFGWSSPELKEWIDNGNDPFTFLLPKDKRKTIDNKNIDRFKDLVHVFKNEIEIRAEGKRFKQLLKEIKKKKLGSEFKVVFDKSIDGVEFYTDVDHLKQGLEKIFDEMAIRTEFPNIKISASKNIEDGYIDVRIVHIDSYPDKESSELVEEINNGDFSDIKKSFESLCDWSIETKCEDGQFKIDYLKTDEKEVICEESKEELQGFTHILRFYR